MVISSSAPFLYWVRFGVSGEALPQESNQFVLGMELGLFSGVYFLNRTFDLTGHALAGFPKLNYECSPHHEFRIWLLAIPLVDVS